MADVVNAVAAGRRRSEVTGAIHSGGRRRTTRRWARPVCVGAHLPASGLKTGRACSCDRVGCPAPGAHPVSPTWQVQATVDTRLIGQWWAARPEASVILVTGRVFDVLDVPAVVGRPPWPPSRKPGSPPARSRRPVAAPSSSSHPRAPFDEDEWWSCRLDCEPENITAGQPALALPGQLCPRPAVGRGRAGRPVGA